MENMEGSNNRTSLTLQRQFAGVQKTPRNTALKNTLSASIDMVKNTKQPDALIQHNHYGAVIAWTLAEKTTFRKTHKKQKNLYYTQQQPVVPFAGKGALKAFANENQETALTSNTNKTDEPDTTQNSEVYSEPHRLGFKVEPTRVAHGDMLIDGEDTRASLTGTSVDTNGRRYLQIEGHEQFPYKNRLFVKTIP